MKPNTIASFLGWFALFLAPCIVTAETTSLAEMLAAIQHDANVSRETLPLDRDWIGDIKDEEGKIERIRLEKGRIDRGQIVLLRTYPNGSYCGSDSPVYVKSIPSDDELRSCSEVAALQKLLGTGDSSFSVWVSPKGMMDSYHSWIYINPTAKDRLTYLRVSGDRSWAEEQCAKGTVASALHIQKADLRPADPDKPDERTVYLSGADKFAAEEAEKEQARQRFPKPLQDLIRVDEHPDDPYLKHLSVAVQAIRDAPDPKLFRQLVEEMHEMRVCILLSHILLSKHQVLKLKPWGAKEEAIAVDACIDALPLAKESSKEDLVEKILHVCGGGVIEIHGKNGGTRIEVVLTKDGSSLTFGDATHPLSIKGAQEELRKLYRKSRAAEQGGRVDGDKPSN